MVDVCLNRWLYGNTLNTRIISSPPTDAPRKNAARANSAHDNPPTAIVLVVTTNMARMASANVNQPPLETRAWAASSAAAVALATSPRALTALSRSAAAACKVAAPRASAILMASQMARQKESQGAGRIPVRTAPVRPVLFW